MPMSSRRLANALAAGLGLALALSSSASAQVGRPGVPRPRPSVAPTPPAGPTAPTLVALDFKGQTVGEVIRALGERSGGQVELFNGNDPRWSSGRVALESAAPVPLWDAADRLSAATSIGRSLTWVGPLGSHRPRIQFQISYGYGPYAQAPAVDYGPAAYVGPFRLGPVVVHEHFERIFLRTGSAAAAVEEAPPFYAEIPLAAEPSTVWLQAGPLRAIEAVDDLGQSLLDPKLNGGILPRSGSMIEVHGPPRMLRVPLARASRPSKALATLRGLLPIEVSRRPTAPTTVVPLEGASGRTVRDGDLTIVVREYRVDRDGKAVLKLNVRLEGPRGEADPKQQRLAEARLWSIYYHQLEPVDAQGKTVALTGGPGPGPDGGLNLDYTYTPIAGAKAYPPTELRIYRPNWVAWDLPIAFRDVPLP